MNEIRPWDMRELIKPENAPPGGGLGAIRPRFWGPEINCDDVGGGPEGRGGKEGFGILGIRMDDCIEGSELDMTVLVEGPCPCGM